MFAGKPSRVSDRRPRRRLRFYSVLPERVHPAGRIGGDYRTLSAAHRAGRRRQPAHTAGVLVAFEMSGCENPTAVDVTA